MKTIEEQIKVMQHFANGGKVEISYGGNGKWEDAFMGRETYFNWYHHNYRIKEQEKTITIEKWLMLGDTGHYFVLEGNISYFEDFKHITKVKHLNTYEIEIC